MIPVVLVGVALLLGRFDPAPHRTGTSTEQASRYAAPTLAIMVLVAVTLSAMILEGAGIDWSANLICATSSRCRRSLPALPWRWAAGAQAVRGLRPIRSSSAIARRWCRGCC